MADENEDIQTEDVSAGQPQPDAGTTVEDTPAAGDSDAAAAAANEDTTDYKSEYEKIQETQKELQAKLTQTSQESARNKQLLEAVTPYVDYTRLQPGAAQQQPAGDEDDDESYVTPKQVKEIVSNVTAKFQQELLAQNVRTKYPDVCDNGPNEVIVRHFLQKDTTPFNSPEERIESAVKSAREHIKSVKDEGKKEAEVERTKAEAEAKAKQAAAAKASGLAATGQTSPSAPQEDQEMTGTNYVKDRRARRNRTQSVSP